MRIKTLLSSWILFSSSSLLYAVTDGNSLSEALVAGGTITFQNSITLTPPITYNASPLRTLPLLYPVNSNPDFSANGNTTTINGATFTLSGNGSVRGFFVRGGTVAINDLTFNQTAATGGSGGPGGATGNGGGGGGGGGGFGGALYVCSGATVTLTNTSFTNSSATGGAGGILSGNSNSGGGGGGLTGAGGATSIDGGGGGGGFADSGGSTNTGAGGGGGGCGQPGANAMSTTGGTGGGNFTPAGEGSGGALNTNGDPAFLNGAGGGGAGIVTAASTLPGSGGAGFVGGGGGGGGSSQKGNLAPNGGSGGDYAGGGGGGSNQPGGGPGNADGGSGGSSSFGGGGGGGGFASTQLGAPAIGGTGGQPGFGGGGGGGGAAVSTSTQTPGTGGSDVFNLGGSGANGTTSVGGAGGGGAGLGGAIFIENGGILNFVGSLTFGTGGSGNSVTGGTGATAGTALGKDIFMQNGATLNFSLTSPLVLSNPIQSENQLTSVGGGVNVGGTSSVTFSGQANTYMGTTTISSSGTLIIDSDGNLGTGPGPAASNPLAMNSTLGNPTLEIAGTVNTVTLAPARGNVTFSGSGTSTFQIDAGNTLNYAGTLALGTGNLAVNTGSSASCNLSGAITGAASTLTASGSGILTLSGGSANTYGGTTTINGGTVDLDKTVGPALPGNVVINTGGTLTQVLTGQIANTSNMTLGGGIFHMGGFATTLNSLTFNAGTLDQGGATLTLSSAGTALTMQTGTTISGPIDLSASGSVVLSGASGTALIGPGTVNLGGGTVTFNMGGSTGPVMQVSGAISMGSLTKTGAGLLNLTGTNTYVGPTIVQSGPLAVNGSITSNVTVNAGATLQGTGTVIGNVDVFGTMSPGNSVGTFNVNGTYTQETGSMLNNEITPTVSDLVSATGNIIIDAGATFALMPDPGIYTVGKSYLVMQSTGGDVTGTFSNFTNTNPIVMGHLVYTPTEVFFQIDKTGLVLMSTTGNAAKVAAALGKIVASGNTSLDPLISTLVPLSHSQLVSALNQLQPSLYKGMAVVQENNVVKVHDAVGYRFQTVLDEKECCVKHGKKRYHVWVHGLGDFADQKNIHFAKSPQVGYDSTTAGIVSGIDFSALENLYVGALGAYTHSNVNWRNDRGYGAVNSGYVGLYTSAIGRIFYGNCAVIRSWNQYDARRNIDYPGLRQSPHNKHSGNQVLTHLDTGVNIRALKMTIRPFDSFDYITQQEQSFKEHGGGMTNLSVVGKTLRMVRNELGINFGKCVSLGRSVLHDENNPADLETKPKAAKKKKHDKSISGSKMSPKDAKKKKYDKGISGSETKPKDAKKKKYDKGISGSETSPNDAKKRRKPNACSETKAHRLVFDFKLSWIREVRFKGESSLSQFSGTGVHFTTIGYFPDRNLFSPGVSVGYISDDDLLDVTAYYVAELNSTYSDQSVGLEVGFHF